MTTTIRTHSAPTNETGAGLSGLGAVIRTWRAVGRQDAQRAERRRVAREIASYPASRGVCMTVSGRNASR